MLVIPVLEVKSTGTGRRALAMWSVVLVLDIDVDMARYEIMPNRHKVCNFVKLQVYIV